MNTRVSEQLPYPSLTDVAHKVTTKLLEIFSRVPFQGIESRE